MAGKFGGDTGVFRLDSALNRLTDDGFGDNWSVVGKRKVLQKFGRSTNLSLNTRSTLWEVGPVHETYLEPSDGNLIDSIVSSSAGDVGDVMRIEGHYFNGDGDLIFSVQFAVLNGQNPVTLSQPLCRCTRMNDSNRTPFVGDVHVYQSGGTGLTGGVPTDLDFAHNVIKGTTGDRQSFKGATTVSARDAFLITTVTLAIQRKQAATVDFGIESAKLTPAGPGGLFDFLPAFGEVSLNSTGQSAIRIELDPVIVIPPNHEVRGVGTSASNGARANVTFSGYLATLPEV